MIAVGHFAAVVDVRCAHAEYRCAQRHRLPVGLNRAIFQRRARSRCGNRLTKVEQAVARIVESSQFRLRQDSDTNAMTIVRGLAASCMAVTGFTAVFEIHTEQN